MPNTDAWMHGPSLMDAAHAYLAQDALRRVHGLSTGFSDLDRALGGLRPGELVVLAGRPAMGCTALALNIVLALLREQNVPVAICTLDHRAGDLAWRLMALRAGVRTEDVLLERLDEDEQGRFEAAGKWLAEALLHIDDTRGLDAEELVERVRALGAEHVPGVVLVDGLREIQGDRAIAVGALKGLAEALRCTMLLLDRVGRGPEKRKRDKWPRVSDLHQAKAVARHADAIALLYRDEYYNPDTDDAGVAEVWVRRARGSGATCTRLMFDDARIAFEAYDGEDVVL